MPRVTQSHLAGRRRQILDGARTAFARHGYEGATVRVLEEATGLTRGAIFHHFADKDSLFLALAEEDTAAMAQVVAERGLVQVMRELRGRDPGWLGVQLEVSRRLRTDIAFRAEWELRLATLDRAAQERLERGRAAGTVRDDVPVAQLATFLRLVLDGLVLHLATGRSDAGAEGVLDLVEEAVRRPRSTASDPGGQDAPTTPVREDT